MDFDKLLNFDKSSDLLVWVVLIIIVVGFGKPENNLGISLFKPIEREEQKHSRRHYKDAACYDKPIALPAPGVGGINKILGDNGLFILLVVALLFLCKDKKEDRDNTCIDKND